MANISAAENRNNGNIRIEDYFGCKEKKGTILGKFIIILLKNK